MPKEPRSIAPTISHEGLDQVAYERYLAAQMKTTWGSVHQRRLSLMDGQDRLASAVQYDLAGTLDGRALRICGVGSIAVAPGHSGPIPSRTLLEKSLEEAARSGADMALLFFPADLTSDALDGFTVIAGSEVTLHVVESPRHGAPMTMVRGGEERDFPAVAAMGRVRAEPFRFHLDRDVDFIHHAITRKRLRAGLGSPGLRQLQFFIAEEGITAAAYVIVSVEGTTWTLEECGDRDASGARVGALLQALIAREPAERRPTIRGWLPPGFLPPQLTVVSTRPSTAIVVMRMLGSTQAVSPQLSAADALYWRNDVF
jgi:hypothetical protein